MWRYVAICVTICVTNCDNVQHIQWKCDNMWFCGKLSHWNTGDMFPFLDDKSDKRHCINMRPDTEAVQCLSYQLGSNETRVFGRCLRFSFMLFLHLALYQVELYCLQNLLKPKLMEMSLLIFFISFISLLIHLISRLQSPFSCSPECFFVCRDLKKVTKAWKTISWMRLYYFGFHCGVGHVVLPCLCWMQDATDALCSMRYTSPQEHVYIYMFFRSYTNGNITCGVIRSFNLMIDGCKLASREQ